MRGRIQLRGDIRAETSLGQPDIQDRQVRLVAFAEFDRFIDGASDAAHLIAVPDENVFKHVGHEEVIFGS